MITVVRRSSGAPSAKVEGPFTGEIWRDMLHQDEEGYSVGRNFFTPCARTYWHTHPGGQLLVIDYGDGLVATRDEIVRVSAGDVVWTPPDVSHWHGATSGNSMLHTSVTFRGVEWQEEVSEQHYAAANEPA